MKRPLLLPLAIALALGGTNALALGLGPVQVKSRLNQPLDAEIPVIEGSAAEAAGLLVNLAGDDDFARVGLDRSRLHVPLEFTVVKGAHGTVIKVTSKEPVRDSYLDFLVEANWPKGRLLREYTVLLDPPLSAPVHGVASSSSAAQSTARATTRALPEQRRSPVVASSAQAASRRTSSAPARTNSVKEGEYGPVEAGDTLSAIAGTARANEQVSLNKMMLAMLKANPNAFFKDNINALKRGAVLRIPSASEINAVGSESEAAAQVRSQIEDWRGGHATPTLVAGTGGNSAQPETIASATASKAHAVKSAAGKAESQHLELVPPKAGKDSVAMADRPGSGAGSAAATSELKSELERTKEALATRQQESGDLTSRVKELEDLKTKNDHLLSLKDSEIADLQQKLKQLRENPAQAGVKPVPPASVPPASPAGAAVTAATGAVPKPVAPTNSKDEIWGNPGSASAAKSATASDEATPPTAATAISKAAAGNEAKTETGAMPTPSAVIATPSAAAGNANGVTGTTPAPAQSAPPTKPAAIPPVKPAVKPVPMQSVGHNALTTTPWYAAAWVKPAAIVAAIILLLLGLFGLRKRKVVPAASRGSIADSFGDSPLGSPATSAAGVASFESEEAHLHEQLEADPANVGLHLELLGLYYSERETAKFEDAAAEMHKYVTDPHTPEWLEAQAMGQELAPHNPLFAGDTHYDEADMHALADDVAESHPDDAIAPSPYEESPTYALDEPVLPHADTAFDVPPMTAPTIAATASATEHGFDFADLPPLEEFHEVAESEPVPAVTPAHAAHLDDDYVTGDDAIGTKLDLAKAYMDMGDPEGARSMLEEVVAEGNTMQRAEANRLMADIG
jgi:pilus assembly protein FimV